jgi:hypothetical protein
MMALVLRYYAVSIVFEKTTHETARFDDDNLRCEVDVQVGCVTGFAPAYTAGDAVAAVRAANRDARLMGFTERLTQTHEIDIRTGPVIKHFLWNLPLWCLRKLLWVRPCTAGF